MHKKKKKEYSEGFYKTKTFDASFTCKSCGRLISPLGAGTNHRNHCPNCLCSLHLDDEPGDRSANCGGIMEAIAVWVKKGGEWSIIHKCKICGVLNHNRSAYGL